MVEGYVRWLEGESQKEISKWMKPLHIEAGGEGLSQAMVSKLFKRIGGSIAGFALEALLEDTELTPEKGWTRGGKNTPDPDFISDDTVVSVKYRTEQSVTIHPRMLAESEKREAIENGKRLLLWYYEVESVKVKRIYEFVPIQNTVST